MILINKVFQFINFYWKAKTIHSIHSPLVFDFISNTLEDDRQYYSFEAIEKERTQLLNDDRPLRITELGAGSTRLTGTDRTISEIAEVSVSTPRQCQLLYRMVKWKKPAKMIEFGSSLGISTLYMFSASKSSELITVEGSPEISVEAIKVFNKHKAPIHLLHKTFDDALDQLAKTAQSFDFVYLDGHHDYKATLSYLDQLADLLNDQAVLVIDDIYWSRGMIKSWKRISKDDRFDLSIDFFFKGVLIKNSNIKQKQNFRIVPKRWKPFSLGVWP